MTGSGLKVLHLTEGYDGGIVTHLRCVLGALRARGVEVALLCSPRRGQAQQGDIEGLRALGVEVQTARMGRSLRPWSDVAALARIVRLIRGGRFQIVHTHCLKAGVLGRVAARLVGGVAVVHTPHCFAFMRSGSRPAAWAVAAVERRLAAWTDCLVLVSESQRREAVASGIDAARHCEVIPNALPGRAAPERGALSSLRKELALDPRAAVVGTLCRLVPYKCADHFVRAAAEVRRRLPATAFLVAGDGPQRQSLSRLARSLAIENAIRFIGHRDDVGPLVALMDVCVLCSRAEGMPYAILEAMRAGASVVASAVPGNIDLIEHGRTGLLFEWGRIDQLADAITRCLTDTALRLRLVRQACRQVAARHDLNDQIDRILEVYQRVARAAVTPGNPRAEGLSPRTTPLTGEP